MPGTLLIGHPRVTWREWLKEHRKERDLICLDPADPAQLLPGVLNLFKGSRPVLTRFYGSLDPQRQPHLLVATLAQMIRAADADPIVQLFAYRPTPVLRQTVMLCAQMLRPDRIAIATGTDLDQSGFPVGPEEVELEAALPPMVQHAQRKAQWLKLLEECERHHVDLRKVTVEGARFGSGTPLDKRQREEALLKEAVYAEVYGSALLVVCDADLEESQIARALDYTGCSKAVIAEPGAFRNLVCSFARQDGEDFGFGMLVDIDWRSMRAEALCNAVAPAPIRLLRLGALRVDSEGREWGEVRPWQV